VRSARSCRSWLRRGRFHTRRGRDFDRLSERQIAQSQIES
jgi:hypothetical protein